MILGGGFCESTLHFVYFWSVSLFDWEDSLIKKMGMLVVNLEITEVTRYCFVGVA